MVGSVIIKEDSQHYDPVTKAARCYTSLVRSLREGPRPFGTVELFEATRYMLLANLKSSSLTFENLGSDILNILSEFREKESELMFDVYKFAAEYGIEGDVCENPLFEEFNKVLSIVNGEADIDVFKKINRKCIAGEKSPFQKK